jgi:hypothetical protein
MWISISAILTDFFLSFSSVFANQYCLQCIETRHDHFLSRDSNFILHNDETTGLVLPHLVPIYLGNSSSLNNVHLVLEIFDLAELVQ